MDWKQKFCQPSKLDEFAQYLTGNTHNYENAEEYTEELFIDKLLIRKQTDAMQIGTALHKVLEVSEYQIIPRLFTINDGNNHYKVNVKNDIQIQIPVLREMWVTKEFQGLTIRGKVDAISACNIHDFKFTSKVNIARYMDSWQWRVYLWMNPKHTNFIYDLFTVKLNYIKDLEYVEKGSTFDPEIVEVATELVDRVDILNYESLELYRYAGLEQEVEEMYSEYFDTLEKLKPWIMNRAHELRIEI